jgi:serine/threonine-protein kinase RsbW
MNAPHHERQLLLRNSRAEVDAAIEALAELWVELGLEPDVEADLNIAVEEMLTNVVRHGKVSGDGEAIRVKVDVSPVEARIEIEDRGEPFNPTEYPPPNIHATLEERKPGGLGIMMVRKMMDETRYERRDGWNCFVMVRRLVR